MRGLALVLATLLGGCLAGTDDSVTGLHIPHDGILAQHGVERRCGHIGPECRDEALENATNLISALGEPYHGPRERVDVPDFEVFVDRNPAWQWVASDGSAGQSNRILFDLTAVLTGVGQPFAVIGGGDGDGPAFTIPDDIGQRVVEALFVES